MTLGGFQSAVRVARDPSRFRRQGRLVSGAQASLRDGGAGGGPRELLGCATRARLGFASLAEGEGNRGVFRRRQRCRRDTARSVTGKGIRPEPRRRRSWPFRVTIVRTQRESHGGGNTVVSRGSVAVDGEAIRQHREIVGLGGLRKASGSACRARRSYLRPRRKDFGATRRPRVRRVPELGAFPIPLAFRRQDRGGNITASDALWVIGCVRSAVCQVSVGVGVRVEVARCSRRAERASFARSIRGLAALGLRRSAASMPVRRGRGNMSEAPRAYVGSGGLRPVHASRLRAPRGSFGDPEVHRRQGALHLCDVRFGSGMLCVPGVLGPPAR